MIHSLLNIEPAPDGNYYFDGPANGIGEACIYALIGMLVVVIGIVLIIFVIWLIGLVLRKTNNLEFLSKLKLPERQKRQAEQETSNEVESDEISDEIKAAIVAAIMAYYDGEKPECEFIVRRIKRIEVC